MRVLVRVAVTLVIAIPALTVLVILFVLKAAGAPRPLEARNTGSSARS